MGQWSRVYNFDGGLPPPPPQKEAKADPFCKEYWYCKESVCVWGGGGGGGERLARNINIIKKIPESLIQILYRSNYHNMQ